MAIENLPSHLDSNDSMVKQAQRGKGWGKEDQARYDALVKARTVKNKPKEKYPGYTEEDDKQQKFDLGKPSNPIDFTQTGDNDSVPKNETIIKDIQNQNVNQNNDINTNVNGNNNTVITEQDNSIRQYGGDNRSFVYNGGGGKGGVDTPVSAATMSGFYAPDDSPAAQAKRTDMWTTMNRDNQKRYAGDAMKTFAKYGNIDARSYTDESMENTINRGIQYSFDRSDRQTGHVFGDIWNDNYITEDWKMPSAPAAIESNAEDIADKAKDDIEDM